MTTADLKPYPGYKPSGVEWLGEVPAHWDVERLKRCMANIIEQTNVRNENELYVGLEHVESWTGRLTEVDEDIEFDSQVKSFEAGDILFGKLRPYLAKVTRPTRNGVCVGEFLVLRPRDKKIVGACIERSLRAKPMIDAVDSSTFGAKMPRADWHFVGAMPIAVPPVTEQIAIVRFLDHADRRIQRYIHTKEKLIALLEEQKQAVIHQAVTGQIDVRTGQPYPAYKPSGFEYLGDVPAHWGVVRLKDVAQVQTGLTLGKDYGGARTISRPYLRVANVQAGHLNLDEVKSIDVPASEAERSALLGGDVLMTEGGDIDKLGRGCIWNNEIPGCLHQNHIFAVRCNRSTLDPEFLVGLMASQHGRAYFQLTGKQTTNLASTNSTTLRSFPIPLPPLDDQLSILRAISETANALDRAAGRAATEIDLLREYRTRLIADVVTGKLDVREAAATLPEESSDPDAAEADCAEPEGGDDDRPDRDRRTAVPTAQEEMTP